MNCKHRGKNKSIRRFVRPQSRMEALFRTVTTDCFRTKYPAPSECAEQFGFHIGALLTTWLQLAKVERDEWPRRKRFAYKLREKMLNIAGRHQYPSIMEPLLQLVEKEPPSSPYANQWVWDKAVELVQYRNDLGEGAMAKDKEAPMADFRIEVNLSLGARRIFRSDNGFLGLAPLHSYVGDQVWILAGMSTPVVLRSCENGNWKLLGEAYVHGAMHGEFASPDAVLKNIVLE